MATAKKSAGTHRRRHWLLALLAVLVLCGVAGIVLGISCHHEAAKKAGASLAQQTKPDMAACIAQLPLAFKLGQKLMLSATTATMAQAGAEAAAYHIGGVILMDQVPAALVSTYTAAQTAPSLIATDQEGGTVQRYTTEGLLPAAADVPAQFTVAQITARLRQDDSYLKSQGVNMNLAPLADVAPVGGVSVLGSRTFSDDPAVVAQYDRAYVNAALDAGMLPTLKHFPGLGSASGNTDYGPATTPNFTQLQARDLVPYRQLTGTKAAIMVGNQIVPGLTAGLPASLSPAAITTELRGVLGYKENVVITDSLSAQAITDQFTIAEAVVKSWEAGSDIALVVQSDPQQIMAPQQLDQIVSLARTAVNHGELRPSAIDNSVARIFALNQKHIDACKIDASSTSS